MVPHAWLWQQHQQQQQGRLPGSGGGWGAGGLGGQPGVGGAPTESMAAARTRAIAGNFHAVATEVLGSMDALEERFTVAADKHTFNFLVTGGYGERARARPPGTGCGLGGVAGLEAGQCQRSAQSARQAGR
jgi:hypothetical protein